MRLHVGPSLVVVEEGEPPTGMHPEVLFMVRLFFSAALHCHPDSYAVGCHYCRQQA